MWGGGITGLTRRSISLHREEDSLKKCMHLIYILRTRPDFEDSLALIMDCLNDNFGQE